MLAKQSIRLFAKRHVRQDTAAHVKYRKELVEYDRKYKKEEGKLDLDGESGAYWFISRVVEPYTQKYADVI